jgi:hypothetical protein
LKQDPELNIRGAAALLKKLYDENPKPDFAKPQDIESWYNAIIKYCGIPQPYLSHHHALNCYVYMTKGYDQYGMHWTPHPVNLAPMEADVRQLRAEFDAAIKRSNETNSTVIAPPSSTNTLTQGADTPDRPTNTVFEHMATSRNGVTHGEFRLHLWQMGIVAFLIIVVVFGRRKRQ